MFKIQNISRKLFQKNLFPLNISQVKRSLSTIQNNNKNNTENNNNINNNDNNNRKKVNKYGPLTPLVQSITNYASLSKFRLSALVVFTTSAGYFCTGLPFDPMLWSSTCFGTALCAASANTFNQIFERDYDSLMNRTKQRPLPSGKLSVSQAVTFGTVSGALGVGTLLTFSNPVVALLGAGNILLYAGPYTSMKRFSEANTWVGAVVGAIPPAMGWAAATGGDLMALDNLAVCSLLFLWQFPHFFALSWLHREDYRKGGFQMIPVNDVDGSRTSKLIWRYSLYLTALPPLTTLAGLTSSMFLLEASTINLYLLYLSDKFSSDRTNSSARRIFLCSLWYLPLLLVGYIIHNKHKNKITNNITVDNEIENLSPVELIRKTGKELCVHEVLFQKDSSSSGNSIENNLHANLCPKISSDKLVATVTTTAEEAENIAVEVLSSKIEEAHSISNVKGN